MYSCAKKDELVKADALLFHLRDLESELINSHKSDFGAWLAATAQLPFKTAEAKLKSNANQVWVLWNDEATQVDVQFDRISNLFNWTLSYRTTSEVYEGRIWA